MDILSDVKRFCMGKHVNISGLTFQQNTLRILLFSVNTKCISSSELKTSDFSRVLRTRDNSDVFNSLDEIYLVCTETNANFLFILYNTRAFSNSQGRR